VALTRIWYPSPNYSSRGGAGVRLIVIHTAEGARTIESLGSWFANPSAQCSSHVGADDKAGTVGEYVKRPNKAWTQSEFNPVAVSLELCGFAAWDTAEWDRHPNMLDNCARWIAEEAAYWNVPITRLTASQAQGSDRGVCQHRDLGSRGGGHSDCGDGFPMDRVLAMARGEAAPPTEEEMMAITAVQNHDGRLEVFVEKDDGSVVHTWQKTKGGAWEGSEPGKPAGWFSLGKP
jgi:hypothetical protein